MGFLKDWYLYVLLCSDGTYYTGVTTSIDRRLHEHNATRKGAKYTRSRRPVKLVFCIRFTSQSVAKRAEYGFKRLSRAEKQRIITEYSKSRRLDRM